MPLPSCGREPSLETGARGVRPEAGRCCALGPRGPCSALPVTLGHSIIRPLAPRRDVGGRADPQGPEPLLGTALPCMETAWHPTWHPQKPWPRQTQAGRREGPWEQPCVPPFPRRDTRHGIPSSSREAGTGRGGLLSAAGRAPPAGAGWRWAQPRLGVCCTSLGSQHVQTAAGGLVPARPHASGTTAARKPGLQGDFAAKVPRPGPSTTAAEQDKLTPWGPSAHLCLAPAWAGSQPGRRPAPVSSRGPLTVVGEGARGRKARRGRGPAGRGRRARERAGVGVS